MSDVFHETEEPKASLISGAKIDSEAPARNEERSEANDLAVDMGNIDTNALPPGVRDRAVELINLIRASTDKGARPDPNLMNELREIAKVVKDEKKEEAMETYQQLMEGGAALVTAMANPAVAFAQAGKAAHEMLGGENNSPNAKYEQFIERLKDAVNLLGGEGRAELLDHLKENAQLSKAAASVVQNASLAQLSGLTVAAGLPNLAPAKGQGMDIG